MTFWLPVIIIGLGTFLYRFSFLSGLAKLNMPRQFKKALEYVPVSVMAALVAIGFFTNDRGEFVLYPPNLLAALSAAAAAFFFKMDILTIIIGLSVYWAAQTALAGF